jgi:polyphosphate kinase 2 (PPK2 family)
MIGDDAFMHEATLDNAVYKPMLRNLQIELLKLQRWVKQSEQKIVIVFEGIDAAGKGGTIKRFTDYLNPRGARIVALNKPSDTERTQ